MKESITIKSLIKIYSINYELKSTHRIFRIKKYLKNMIEFQETEQYEAGQLVWTSQKYSTKWQPLSKAVI